MSNKNEIVITSALRTAIGSMGGTLKNTPGHELGSCVISEAINKSKFDKKDVDEIIMGQVLTGGAGQNPARQASMMSGLPKEKPAYVVNQVCGSGLRSVASGFQSIISGDSKIVVAGGQESMSSSPHAINIRAGKKLNIEEMNSILSLMEKTPNASQCNHGRPTSIRLSLKEIEKLFQRT